MATYAVGFKNVVTGRVSIAMTGLSKEEATNMKNAMTEAETEIVKAVMKIEMNKHEKAVDRLIQNAVSEIIGGFENTLYDYAEDDEEYKEAKRVLNHDTLFDMIYGDVIAESENNADSHIRFAGKKFIEDRIEARLKKEGYGK